MIIMLIIIAASRDTCRHTSVDRAPGTCVETGPLVSPLFRPAPPNPCRGTVRTWSHQQKTGREGPGGAALCLQGDGPKASKKVPESGFGKSIIGRRGRKEVRKEGRWTGKLTKRIKRCNQVKVSCSTGLTGFYSLLGWSLCGSQKYKC